MTRFCFATDMHSARLKYWSNFAGCVATEKGAALLESARCGRNGTFRPHQGALLRQPSHHHPTGIIPSGPRINFTAPTRRAVPKLGG